MSRIKKNRFFLYFATHNIHVPRVVNKKFAGKSIMGARGDAILEMDWEVGQIMNALKRLNLTNNTMVVFSSDNGPVLDDGYQDKAVEKQNGHKPAGPLRGGKYSAFDGGTRLPLIVSWPGHIAKGTSNAVVSQIDFMASFAHLAGNPFKAGHYLDSYDALDVLMGQNRKGRDFIIEHALNNTLALVKGNWKYIMPSNGPAINKNTNTELGNNPQPQLYNIKTDVGELNNQAGANPQKLNELKTLLQNIKSGQVSLN